MQCGWIPEAERPADKSALLESWGSASDPVPLRDIGLCPGYLVRLRAVGESAQARSAMENGVLEIYFPGLEGALLDGAMASLSASNIAECERIKKESSRG
jgi:hypothetical protein